MEAQFENPAREIRRLQRCIADLISVMALPAIWSGNEPPQIAQTLVDALPGMLNLDMVFVRLNKQAGEVPVEMVSSDGSHRGMPLSQTICDALNRLLGDDPEKWPSELRIVIGSNEICVVPIRLGLQGELGVVAAGSHRSDFPGQAERLLLSVAANQVSIALQEARLRSQQMRLARELDQRVAERTTELGMANEELRREVSDRKMVEEKLRQEEVEFKRSQAYLAEAQRLSITGSFGWRVVTDEHFWSEETFRIFGYDRSAPVTLQLIKARVHPQDLALMEQAIALAADGRNLDYECRLLMPGGSVKYLHIVGHGMHDKEGRLEYIGAVQDVTERRLSEEMLGKVRTELAHMARVTSLGALTASIAHEVNQPLSGIITNASTCLRMLATEPPNVEGARETARRTIRDGNRASEVITRLRALFSKKQIMMESVDINEAAKEVIALSLSEFQRKQVVLRLEFFDDLPPVTGDRVQLQQVILNLLLNAMEAMAGVDDRPRQMVVRTQYEDVNCVRLSVQDVGVGLDPQGMDRLFEAFYTTKRDGMGMGLSVSRSIIERHHGRLWAAPNDGPGATFSFSIPCKSAGKSDAQGNAVLEVLMDRDAAQATRSL